jgi:hypothetical protein
LISPGLWTPERANKLEPQSSRSFAMNAAGTGTGILAGLRAPAEILIVPEDERLPDSCLHCEINDVVRDYIEQHTPTNLPDLVAKMSESFVDLILLGPEEEWGTLLADAIRQIGEAFLEKSGAIEGGSDTAH